MNVYDWSLLKPLLVQILEPAGIDIDTVFDIRVTPTEVTVNHYLLNDDGRPYSAGGGVAKRQYTLPIDVTA